MSFDFEHLKKLCVCKRTTKGFDYGETHPNLGKCGVGQRWSSARDNIDLVEKKYKELEKKASEYEKAANEWMKSYDELKAKYEPEVLTTSSP